LPGADEDGHAPAAADGTGLSPGAQAQPGNCGLGGVRGDHPGSPGGGAAVPPEVGFDVSYYWFKVFVGILTNGKGKVNDFHIITYSFLS